MSFSREQVARECPRHVPFQCFSQVMDVPSFYHCPTHLLHFGRPLLRLLLPALLLPPSPPEWLKVVLVSYDVLKLFEILANVYDPSVPFLALPLQVSLSFGAFRKYTRRLTQCPLG